MRPDLIQHFFGGALIAMLSGFFVAPLFGFALATVIGILKEAVYDGYLKRGTEDITDVYATTLGGGFGAAMLLI